MWRRWRSRPNPCVIPAQGRGSRDKDTLNSNSRSSRSGQAEGRGGGRIDVRKTNRRRHSVGRRRGGRLHTRHVARDVPSVGLGHAWIREGMGRVERFSYSGNLLWGKGNEMN